MTTLAAIPATDSIKTRRIEMILRQVESLPTLPAVAVRLLALTTSDQSHAREVIELIASDQALTSRVFALCRRAERGLREEGLTIDKAVVLLGFNAVRHAVLSIKVLEFFDGPNGSGPAGAGGATPVASIAGDEAVCCDRKGLWRHSLATAIAAERLALAHPNQPDLPPDQAFVAGLLHDIGKLALDWVLPKAYSRVVELVDLNQGDIAEFERRIIGLDHHTAGKRLAEQWQLPHHLQDCIWLHGSAYPDLAGVPRVEHRRLIGLVALADLLVRRSHVGYSGNFTLQQDPEILAQALGLDPRRVLQAAESLHQLVDRRMVELGVDADPSPDLLLQSLQQANHMLGQINAVLDRRTRAAQRQGQVLDAIASFHGAAVPGRNVQDVLSGVIAGAQAALGPGFYATIQQGGPDEPWLISQYTSDGRAAQSQLADPPPGTPALSTLDATQPAVLSVMGILPWVTDYLIDAPDLRTVRVLPLGCGWGTAALLLHDRSSLPPRRDLSALALTWGAAIAAAGQHDGARRLGEELAQANRALAQAQDRLLQSESLTRLGEMAAGAAHEMNNPLAVISGRAQLLAQSLPIDSQPREAAQTIVEQSHRLSDLITDLRLFADPPRPNRKPTSILDVLETAARRLRDAGPAAAEQQSIHISVAEGLGLVSVDGEQVGQAVYELLRNAVQAGPKNPVRVRARQALATHQLVIEVADDGAGMDPHTFEHALDPFFSAKAAGRNVGMGLPRARQLARAHGGDILLRSQPGQGTVAVLTIGVN